MQVLTNRDCSPGKEVGFLETWYLWSQLKPGARRSEVKDGIDLTGKTRAYNNTQIPYNLRVQWAHSAYNGIQVANPKWDNLKWCPFQGPYNTYAFLVNGSLVITNFLKEMRSLVKGQVIIEDNSVWAVSPAQVVTIQSNTMEKLIETAQNLDLPTESLEAALEEGNSAGDEAEGGTGGEA